MQWFKISVGTVLFGSFTLVTGLVAKPCPRPDVRTCAKNPALGLLKLLRADKFCSEFLDLETVTVRKTCTASTVVPATLVVSAKTTIPYIETTSATVSQAVVVVESIPGPSLTITVRPTATVSVTITSSFSATVTSTSTVTQYMRNARRDRVVGKASHSDGADGRHDGQDAAAERDRQLEALGVLNERGLSRHKPVIPIKLKYLASAVLSTACACYVTAPTITVKTTTTRTRTAVQTITQILTASTPIDTVVVNIVKTYTQTDTTTLPGVTDTETLLQSETVTAFRSITDVSTAYATVTYSGPGLFTLQFSGMQCVQNIYTHYDLVNEAYSTPERLFQVCAVRCASYGSACGSFYAYEDRDYPYMWCIIDSGRYQSSFRQCGIPFAGVGLAYNSPF